MFFSISLQKILLCRHSSVLIGFCHKFCIGDEKLLRFLRGPKHKQPIQLDETNNRAHQNRVRVHIVFGGVGLETRR